MDSQQWEYRTEHDYLTIDDIGETPEFNRMGEQGWELVSTIVLSVITNKDGYPERVHTMGIFKRPLPQ